MRLIDADELLERFVEKGQCSNRYKLGENWELNFPEIYDVVNQQPTIEAEPIKHGEWLMDDESGDIKCSCCGHWSYDTYDEPFVIDGHKGIATIMPHYCGYCGAKMD